MWTLLALIYLYINFYFLIISFCIHCFFVNLHGWFVCWPWDSTQSPGFDSRYEQQNIRTKKYLQFIYLLYTSVAKKYYCVTITNKNGLRLGKKKFLLLKNKWMVEPATKLFSNEVFSFHSSSFVEAKIES